MDQNLIQKDIENYSRLLRVEMKDALAWMVAYQKEKIVAQNSRRHRKVSKIKVVIEEKRQQYEDAKQKLEDLPKLPIDNSLRL